MIKAIRTGSPSSDFDHSLTKILLQKLDSEEEDEMAKGLVEICENYSKAHGSYVAWETDVDLSPPKSWGKQVGIF